METVAYIDALLRSIGYCPGLQEIHIVPPLHDFRVGACRYRGLGEVLAGKVMAKPDRQLIYIELGRQTGIYTHQLISGICGEHTGSDVNRTRDPFVGLTVGDVTLCRKLTGTVT